MASIVIPASMACGDGVTLDSHSPIPACKDRSLPSSVEGLLRPVLLARAAALRTRIEWDTTYETEFYGLLDKKGPNALEAKVALMAYYTGEHYGEELLEVTLAQPSAADPLIRRYRECRPLVTFEAQLNGVVVLRTLYEIYEEERASKK